jgi:hypothetical protein
MGLISCLFSVCNLRYEVIANDYRFFRKKENPKKEAQVGRVGYCRIECTLLSESPLFVYAIRNHTIIIPSISAFRGDSEEDR